MEGLEITVLLENSQVGIRPSPQIKVMRSIAQLKRIYTNACSMDNKQGKLEAIVELWKTMM